jgi:hypothetical protein
MRASDDCDPENLVGVRFPMLDDSDRTKRVICLVTYAALQDRATFDAIQREWRSVRRDRRLDANRMIRRDARQAVFPNKRGTFKSSTLPSVA